MAQAMLSSMISSADLTSRASSIGLLAVADRDPELLERCQHRRLDDVDADRHVGHALGAQDLGDLLRRAGEQARIRRDRAAQADHPAPDVLRQQPRAVQPVMLGRRAEVPQVRLAARG